MRLIIFSFLVAALAGCSDPRDTVLPQDIDKWKSDQSFVDAMKKLPEDEQKMVLGYAMRASMAEAFGGDGIGQDVTIADAIKNQKSFIEKRQEQQVVDQKKKAEKDRIENERIEQRNQVAKEMHAVLGVSLDKFDYVEKDYQTYFSMHIKFNNKTDRPIAGVKGELLFSDMFGELIKKIRVSYDQGVPANDTALFKGTVDYNQFMDADNKLRSVNKEKMKVEWVPGYYIFEDGTEMKLP